jgi:hypothetical protein
MIQYKSQVGDGLYSISFSDGTVIPFRLLTNKEFSSCRTSLALDSIPEEEVHNYIYKACVLDKSYVDDTDDLRAGIPTTVARVIFHMSGPTSIEFVQDLMVVEREAAQTLESQMKSAICKTFSGYTMERLDELDFPTLIGLFAQAEAILLEMGLIDQPFEFFTPDHKEEEKKDLFSQLEDDGRRTQRALG